MTINEFIASYPYKTKPYQHQEECLRYGLLHNCFLLGDEQGLGKTKETIDIAVAYKKLYGYNHCLIICGVATLRYNWANEVLIHSNEDCWILGERINPRTGKVSLNGNKERIADMNDLISGRYRFPYFIIINIEAIRNEPLFELIRYAIEHDVINMALMDEIHKCKNPEALQTQRLLGLMPDSRIAMSGTLVLNNPLDLYVPFAWTGGTKSNFYAFRNHFCIMGGMKNAEVLGYRNQYQLRDMVKEHMLRRKRKDVLDLPPKIYTTEYLEMGPAQQMIYDEVLMYTKAHLDRLLRAPNPANELIRLRQATAHTSLLSTKVNESVKFERMEEIIEEAILNDDKVIVYSNWAQVCELAYYYLKKYNPAIYTGEVLNCEEHLQKFHKDPTCKVIIGTIGKLGTGLTLTEAATIIFLDKPWNRGTAEQAEDRAYRIGTTRSVNVITLCCKDTIDEIVERIIYKKGETADYLIDGKSRRSDDFDAFLRKVMRESESQQRAI